MFYGDKIQCASGLPCEVTRQLDHATGRYYYVVLHIPTCAHATDYMTQLRNERDEARVNIHVERMRLYDAYREREALKRQLEQEKMANIHMARAYDNLSRSQSNFNEPIVEPKKEEKYVCKQHDTDQVVGALITKYKKPALTATAILAAYMFRTDIMFMTVAAAAVFSYISYCRCKDPFNLMGNKK